MINTATLIALSLALGGEPEFLIPGENLSPEWTLDKSGKLFEKGKQIRVTCPAEGKAWLHGPFTYHLCTRPAKIQIVEEDPRLTVSATIENEYELKLFLGYHLTPDAYRVRVGDHVYLDFECDGRWEALIVDSGKGKLKRLGWRDGRWQPALPKDIPFIDSLLDFADKDKDQSQDNPRDLTPEEEKRKLRREWKPDQSGKCLVRSWPVRITRPKGKPEETPWTYELSAATALIESIDRPGKSVSASIMCRLVKKGENEIRLLLNAEGKPRAVRVQIAKNVYYDHDRDGVWDEFIDGSQRGGPKRFLWKEETWQEAEFPKKE